MSQPTTAAGTATQQNYSYPAAGTPQPHAVSEVSTQAGVGTPVLDEFTYDESGNTTGRPGQVLEYDALGKLAKATIGSSTQQNIYDAAGSLLLRIDSVEGSTLYLGMTELHKAAGASTTSGVRTYSAQGNPVAERTTTAGVSGSVLQWLTTDIVGTSLMQVNSSSGVVKRRYLDPFGIPATGSPAWSSNHAYLNAPTSETTELTHLGAREYDPTLGRFLSVDAVLAPFTPQQNNGYSYSANSPITRSDPSGNCFESSAGVYSGSGCSSGKKSSSSAPKKSTSAAPPSAGSHSGLTASRPTPSSKVQWWDFTAWSGETWQNIGAAATGMAIGIGITAAILGATACTVVTFGVCGAIIIGAAVAGGAAAGLVTYNLSAGEKTAEGRLSATAVGAVAGAAGGVAGAAASGLVAKLIGAVGGKAGAQTATGAAARTVKEDGIIYFREDRAGSKPYVGQSIHEARYDKRQVEHAITAPEARYDFSELGRAAPGVELNRLEEAWIQHYGGPTNLSNPNGGLANKRHQMSDINYLNAGGDPR